MSILYGILLVALSLYSYALVDPNITFFKSDIWTGFRNTMFQLGYFQRSWSTVIYILITLLLFVFHIRFLKRYNTHSALKISVITGFICLFAYPFVSHDLFNYIFDARILMYYHQNPYTHSAMHFPADHMTRFMHWTHRNYAYGPTFLAITAIPSFLSFGKFILNFFLFKALFVSSYVAAVYFLSKWKKEWAMFYATHPLVIIDGLVNAHNDILAVSMGLIGLYYIFHKAEVKGRMVLLISGLIKFTTLPVMIFTKNKDDLYTKIGFAGIAAVMFYLTFMRTVQPWYFLIPFVLIPYFFGYLKRLQIFYAGVLLSYTGFVATGEWYGSFMYSMILVPLAINIAYICATDRKRTRHL